MCDNTATIIMFIFILYAKIYTELISSFDYKVLLIYCVQIQSIIISDL